MSFFGMGREPDIRPLLRIHVRLDRNPRLGVCARRSPWLVDGRRVFTVSSRSHNEFFTAMCVNECAGRHSSPCSPFTTQISIRLVESARFVESVEESIAVRQARGTHRRSRALQSLPGR